LAGTKGFAGRRTGARVELERSVFEGFVRGQRNDFSCAARSLRLQRFSWHITGFSGGVDTGLARGGTEAREPGWHCFASCPIFKLARPHRPIYAAICISHFDFLTKKKTKTGVDCQGAGDILRIVCFLRRRWPRLNWCFYAVGPQGPSDLSGGGPRGADFKRGQERYDADGGWGSDAPRGERG